MGRFGVLALVLSGAVLIAASATHARQPESAPDRGDTLAGKRVFDQWCAPCHGRGPGHPGTQSLAVKFHGAVPDALEDRKDLTPQTVGYFVRHGVSLMPFFRKTEVSDKDLRDLSAYLAKGK